MRLGLLLGGLGVLAFSFTVPITRAVVPVFGGWTVGIGRAVGAALLAALLLRSRGARWPRRGLRHRLLLVAAGVVLGFPLFSALALEFVPATHAAVVIGLLPIATACAATWRHGERPSGAFWLAALGGLATVVAFAFATGSGGRPELADGLLLLAVASAALGYAEGASVSRELGGWQTISWALVFALPVTLPIGGFALWQHGVVAADLSSYLGFGYLTAVSMFLGFFFWYAGLARGGTARVGQLQLVQPILTLCWSALFLGEVVGKAAMGTAGLVIVFVLLTGRAPVGRVSGPA
ncbi:MAG: DMT family transporter [Planctomycetota bacterium]|nr:DMT family transporter [Planctomycetota bacterium]